MLVFYCDICGKAVNENGANWVRLSSRQVLTPESLNQPAEIKEKLQQKSSDICSECADLIEEFIEDLKSKQDNKEEKK